MRSLDRKLEILQKRIDAERATKTQQFVGAPTNGLTNLNAGSFYDWTPWPTPIGPMPIYARKIDPLQHHQLPDDVRVD